MKRFFVKKEYQGMKVGDYLKQIQLFSSRSIRKIEIYINNKRVKPNKKIRYRNVVKVIEKKKGTNIKPIPMDLDIVYEDGEILIVDKPPNLVVHPTKKKVKMTLANGIVDYFKSYKIDQVPRFYNRLDMDTSGIIVVTKTAYAQAFLQNSKDVNKYYYAVVKGIIEKDNFIVEGNIGIKDDGIKRCLKEDGQYSKTEFKTLKRLENEDLTLIEAKLFTGRTHQIRVHLSSLGFPIIGDSLYGDKMVNFRQMLHSYKIEFTNPSTKQKQIVETDFPKDMKKILKI